MNGTKAVGIIGLGLVGKAVASRLLEAGYSILGYDIDRTAMNQAGDLGVERAASAQDIVRQCSLTLLSLPDSDIVNSVLWGEQGIGPGCPRGAVLLDTTTARPKETVAHHNRLEEQGVRFIDAPLVGSSEEIGRGDGVALVGERREDADYLPVLEAIAKRVFFLGGAGQGHRAKLVVNLVLGLNRLVFAEGLALAEKCGMDGRRMLEILKGSSAYSTAMDVKGEKMLARDYTPVARLAQHAKDVDLILELASEAGARAPLSIVHAMLLAEGIDAGLGTRDNAAIIEVLRQCNPSQDCSGTCH